MKKYTAIIGVLWVSVSSAYVFDVSLRMGISPLSNYGTVIYEMFEYSGLSVPKYIGSEIGVFIDPRIEGCLNLSYIPTFHQEKYKGIATDEYDYEEKISISGFNLEPQVRFVTPAILDAVNFYFGLGIGFMSHTIKWECSYETEEGKIEHSDDGDLGGLYQSFIFGARITGKEQKVYGYIEVQKIGLHSIKYKWDKRDSDWNKVGKYEKDYRVSSDIVRDIGIGIGVGISF